MADKNNIVSTISAARGAIAASGFTGTSNTVMIPQDALLPFVQAAKRLYHLTEAQAGANQVALLKGPKPGQNVTVYASGKVLFSGYPKVDGSVITPEDIKAAEAIQAKAVLDAWALDDMTLASYGIQRDVLEATAASLGVKLPQKPAAS